MDALVPAFIAAVLAGFGDRTHSLSAMLGRRYNQPRRVLVGVAIGALANLIIGGFAGAYLATLLSHRAARLMIGVSLIVAGSGAMIPVKPPAPIDSWRLGAIGSSAAMVFLYALFDRTQLLVVAIAAGSGRPVLTTLGATAGVVVISLPAVHSGDLWSGFGPVRLIRVAAGALLLTFGVGLGLASLDLV